MNDKDIPADQKRGPLLGLGSSDGLGHAVPGRADFEAWANEQGFPLEKLDGMGGGVAYLDMRTHVAWEGFCVGARAERELCAKLCETRVDTALGYVLGPDCAALIRAEKA